MLALLVSTGIVFADSSSQPTMVGSQWAVYEQTTLPNGGLNFYPAAHADTIQSGGVQFQMPDATASSPTYVNYLLDTFTTSLVVSDIITATINVQTNPALTTLFKGNPNGGCYPVSISATTCPGAVRLFFQSNLPNDHSSFCTGGSANVNNYWWSDTAFYTFTPGSSPVTVTLTASLSGAWSNICGQSSVSNSGFSSSISNIKYVGLSFGSGFFFANGVGVDGTTGTATFQLTTYIV